MEQDSSIVTGSPEATDDPGREWHPDHRITAKDFDTIEWIKDRNRDIDAHKTLKQALGHSYGDHRNTIDALDEEMRWNLSQKNPEDIGAFLDERAETDREQKKRARESKRQAAEQAESTLAANETPQLTEVRNAMRKSYQEAASLDDRIAELQRLNEMRHDPAAPEWNDRTAEEWKIAREGNMESTDGELAALLMQKQAKLQEAALHQDAYHEAARATQALQPVADRPVGQITGNDGQPMQITQADIDAQVQLRLDEQAHSQRFSEAAKRYQDWDEVWESARQKSLKNDLPLPSMEQIAFIKTLPNSGDVSYYIVTHPDEVKALARMRGPEAARELINISHKAGRSSVSEAPRKTSAPKPPSPVSGPTSRAFDVSNESLSADEWARHRNEQLRRRGKF